MSGSHLDLSEEKERDTALGQMEPRARWARSIMRARTASAEGGNADSNDEETSSVGAAGAGRGDLGISPHPVRKQLRVG